MKYKSIAAFVLAIFFSGQVFASHADNIKTFFNSISSGIWIGTGTTTTSAGQTSPFSVQTVWRNEFNDDWFNHNYIIHPDGKESDYREGYSIISNSLFITTNFSDHVAVKILNSSPTSLSYEFSVKDSGPSGSEERHYEVSWYLSSGILYNELKFKYILNGNESDVFVNMALKQ